MAGGSTANPLTGSRGGTAAARAAIAARCGVLAALLCVTTSCVDDAFEHPLSEGHPAAADPRLLGTWEVFEASGSSRYAGYRADTLCRIERDPDAEETLRIRQLGDHTLLARRLAIGGADLLFIVQEPDERQPGDEERGDRREDAGESPPRQKPQAKGWILAYECHDAAPPTARAVVATRLAQAIDAGSLAGTTETVVSGILLWRSKTTVPVVDLDAEKSREWIGGNLAAIAGPPAPIGEVVARVIDGPPNALIGAAAIEAATPRALDERLLGTTVSLDACKVFDTYTVEATDEPTMLRCVFTEPEDEPLTITTTTIDGADYANVDNGDRTFTIFRYEFLGTDTLLLIPSDHAYVEAAVLTKLLPARFVGAGRRARRTETVTASADDLRAFVKERAGDCFPEPMSAGAVFVLRRGRGGSDAVKTPR